MDKQNKGETIFAYGLFGKLSQLYPDKIKGNIVSPTCKQQMNVPIVLGCPIGDSPEDDMSSEESTA